MVTDKTQITLLELENIPYGKNSVKIREQKYKNRETVGKRWNLESMLIRIIVWTQYVPRDQNRADEERKNNISLGKQYTRLLDFLSSKNRLIQ